MTELMHALVLVAHFHAFAAFVKGCAHLKATEIREGEQASSLNIALLHCVRVTPWAKFIQE